MTLGTLENKSLIFYSARFEAVTKDNLQIVGSNPAVPLFLRSIISS